MHVHKDIQHSLINIRLKLQNFVMTSMSQISSFPSTLHSFYATPLSILHTQQLTFLQFLEHAIFYPPQAFAQAFPYAESVLVPMMTMSEFLAILQAWA